MLKQEQIEGDESVELQPYHIVESWSCWSGLRSAPPSSGRAPHLVEHCCTQRGCLACNMLHEQVNILSRRFVRAAGFVPARRGGRGGAVHSECWGATRLAEAFY